MARIIHALIAVAACFVAASCTTTAHLPEEIGYSEFTAGAFSSHPTARAVELELNGKGWILQIAFNEANEIVAARRVSVFGGRTEVLELEVEVADGATRSEGAVLRYPVGHEMRDEYSYGIGWMPDELGGDLFVGYPREEANGVGWRVPGLTRRARR